MRLLSTLCVVVLATSAQIQGQSNTIPTKADPHDKGYESSPHGYYDIQGLGVALDYCRYVGDGSNGGPWPSCALAGTNKEYTPRGVISVELVNNGLSPITPKPTSPVALPTDQGYPGIEPRGYFDIFGIGQAVDYCRMVEDYPGWPSCALAGTNNQYTPKGNITLNFTLKKAVPAYLGYSALPRGYYDIQGLGGDNDYCRYVGGSANEQPWPSCALAGSNEPYTTKGIIDVRFIANSANSAFINLVNNNTSILSDVLTPVPIPTNRGYLDQPSGYYDILGSGQNLDYCRFVGNPIYPTCLLAATNQDTAHGAIKVIFVPSDPNTTIVSTASTNFGVSKLRASTVADVVSMEGSGPTLPSNGTMPPPGKFNSGHTPFSSPSIMLSLIVSSTIMVLQFISTF